MKEGRKEERRKEGREGGREGGRKENQHRVLLGVCGTLPPSAVHWTG